MPKNLDNVLAGHEVYGDYDQATAGAAIDELIALLTPDSTSTIRGFLDEMSPAAQAQLIRELNAMKTLVGDFEAGT